MRASRTRRAEWLGDKIVGAHVEGLFNFGIVRTHGQDDDGNLRPFAQLGQNFLAVHVGQPEIEQDQIGA